MTLYRYTRATFAREMAFLFGAVAFCVPLFLLLSISLKSSSQVVSAPLSLPTSLVFGNYATAWSQSGSPTLSRGLVNSVVITGATVLCLVALGSAGGYVLGRRRGRLSGVLYVLFVLGYILPLQLALIPIFMVMRKLDLTGTYLGAVILYTGLLMPFAVFLFTGFVRNLPAAYEEAAQVDGAGPLRTYVSIVLPLLRPIIATVALLAGVVVWNDFFVSLIFLSGSRASTLPAVLYGYAGQYLSQWNLVFAGVAIAVTPMLLFFLLTQRHMIKGFAGGIRG